MLVKTSNVFFCFFSAFNGPLQFACLFYFLALNTHLLKGFHEEGSLLLSQYSLEKVVTEWCSDIGQ